MTIQELALKAIRTSNDPQNMKAFINRVVRGVKDRLNGDISDALVHEAAKEIAMQRFDFPSDIMVAEIVERDILDYYILGEGRRSA